VAYLSLCESPIERKMAIALAYAAWPMCSWDKAQRVGSLASSALASVLHPENEEGAISARLAAISRQVTIEPQAKVLRYRADFLVRAKLKADSDPIKIIVECDGAEFHGTVEQRKRDFARQSELEAAGYFVMRFSGSQIHADPRLCADLVIRAMQEFEIATYPERWKAMVSA
jgi:very-short-patch-repair endonuclease